MVSQISPSELDTAQDVEELLEDNSTHQEVIETDREPNCCPRRRCRHACRG